MRRIKILILIVSLFSFTFGAPISVGASVSAKAKITKGAGDQVCPGGTLHTTLPLPPKGLASTRTITFDEKCNPIFGPIEILPIDQVFTPSQGDIDSATLPVLSDLRTLDVDAIAASYSWTVRADQSLWDCCGIMMNKVYTNGSWTENGSIIQSYSIGGGYQWHTENGGCGNGWYPVNPYHKKTGGGVGYSSTSFRTHSEFGYKGLFDCSGTTYYNILDNYTTIYAGGTGNATCNFTRWSRTWLGSWKWKTSCTR